VSFRALAIWPAVLTALLIGALLVTGLPPAALRAEIELVKLIAVFGSFAAALSFDAGDHLRRAWWLSGACIGFLLVRDALVVLDGAQQLPLRDVVVALLVSASNVSGVISAWLMARTFHVAGLATEESTSKWRMLTAMAFVAVLLVTLPSLRTSVQGIQRGDASSVVWLISGVGDLLALALIAPILLTAIAMRGGVLIWPWALLTAGMASWLLYDLAGTLGDLTLLNLSPTMDRAVQEFFRGLACVYTAAAGFAQRKIVREGAA
jgi:hypothetical protein